MKGKIYSIGVGPGDPELMTLKAVRILKEVDVIACLEKKGEPGVAYGIAEKAVPELAEKEVLALEFPMKKEGLKEAHRKAAEKLMEVLESGRNIGFLTLGDTVFYSSFAYISEALQQRGYEVEIISGITSFAAAAAKLLLPLTLGEESMVITAGEYVETEDTLVIMKAGSKLKEIKDRTEKAGKKAWLVENLGMEDEAIYEGLDSIPDKSGYFSIVIVK